LGREITSDGRYSNSRLSLIPYRTFAAEGLQECMP
jgi:CYTH domain-containing protein